jgi:sirohydrochlorin cobaltochelatase
MKTIIVLAMHGSPPKDIPRMQVVLDVGLHMAIEHGPPFLRSTLEGYYTRLDSKIRNWPRTAENDPFRVASMEMAEALHDQTGYEVVVGFNEFCSPTLEEALEQAVGRDAERVIVVTPMLTRGGEHAEKDIPEVIQTASGWHRGVQFVYAWPFDTTDVARFLGDAVLTAATAAQRRPAPRH